MIKKIICGCDICKKIVTSDDCDYWCSYEDICKNEAICKECFEKEIEKEVKVYQKKGEFRYEDFIIILSNNKTYKKLKKKYPILLGRLKLKDIPLTDYGKAQIMLGDIFYSSMAILIYNTFIDELKKGESKC